MGGLRGFVGVLGVLLAGVVATPAWAVPANVNLGNNKTVSPTLVTIDPGETVTFHWVGPDTNHSPTSDAGTPAAMAWATDGVPGAADGVGNFNHGTPPPCATPCFNWATPALGLTGNWTFHCKVHPLPMRGTIRVTGPLPAIVAKVGPASTVTTTPLTNEGVTLDASGSTDDLAGATIASFEWDLDGNGSFETPPSAVGTTPVTFATAGAKTVGVKVTDSAGQIDTRMLALNVRSRVPAASYTATPGSVSRGQVVTFNAGATTDNDTALSAQHFEWDLDGNPATGVDGFEVDTAATPTASTSYNALGAVTTRLRVTDPDGNVSPIVTRPVIVANQLPVAALTTSTTTAVATVTSVTLNAATSSDPDGTIASYDWDLDGNGSFETPGGASPTVSHVFPTAGSMTVGVRVTDNNGGNSSVTQAIDVTPAPVVTPPADQPSAAPSAPAPAAPTPGLTPVAPGPSTLTITAGGAASQRPLRRTKAILVTVRCSRACSAGATGTISLRAPKRVLRLSAAKQSVGAGKVVTLRLTLSPSVVTTLRKVRSAAIQVTITATDATGARATATRRITLRA
jgi:plastocyanin